MRNPGDSTYNPFSVLYPERKSKFGLSDENRNTSIYTHIITSSLKQRLLDIFVIFNGESHFLDESSGQPPLSHKPFGILDYLGFLAIDALIILFSFNVMFLQRYIYPLYWILYIPIAITSLALCILWNVIHLVIKPILSALLTAVVALVTFLPVIHILTTYTKESIENKIDDWILKNFNKVEVKDGNKDRIKNISQTDDPRYYRATNGNCYWVAKNEKTNNFCLNMTNGNDYYNKIYSSEDELLGSEIYKNIMSLAY